MGDLVWLINQTSPTPARPSAPSAAARPAHPDAKTYVATTRKNRDKPLS